MGYDMSLNVFKKKTLEKAKKTFPNWSFEELYDNVIFTRLYPEEYDVPLEESGDVITYSNENIFHEFYKSYYNKTLSDSESFIVDKETYSKMISWLESKLKKTSLLDIANKNMDENKARELIHVYNDMKAQKIDFTTEFVVFEHSW